MTTKTIKTNAASAVGEGGALDAASAVPQQPVAPVGDLAPAADEQAVAASVAAALDPRLVARLAAQARAQGVSLLGRDGLLQQLTKRFLEATLEAEMEEHLGYDWAELGKDLKPVYQAVSEQAALDAFAEFSSKWEKRYPAIVRLWENAWAEFVPFLAFDPEIRKIICTTNAIESLNARFRRAVNARGHFPTEQAALKVLYLTVRSLDPTGKGAKKWSNRWKAALNAFDITFDGRISAARR